MAKRIFERIQEEGYVGGITRVQEAVRAWKETHQEVYIPLSKRPGEAQVDFGYVLVCMNGGLRKVAFFVMAVYAQGERRFASSGQGDTHYLSIKNPLQTTDAITDDLLKQADADGDQPVPGGGRGNGCS